MNKFPSDQQSFDIWSTCMFVIRNKIPPTATKERAGKSSMAKAVENKEK